MDAVDLATDFGSLLRLWRTERRLSQADLAHAIETPPRHISFLETGRSNPSRDMVARVASALDVPIRDRNALLRAAGFADVYRDGQLSDEQMRQLRRAVDHVIRAQDPFPAFVLDDGWNVLDANDGGHDMMALVAGRFPFEPSAAPVNMLDAVFDAEGFRPYIVNWERYARHFIQRLHREGSSGGKIAETLSRVRARSDLPDDWWRFDVEYVDAPLVSIEMTLDGDTLSFFTVVSAIALPTTALAQDLKIETMFPADPETERLWRDRIASPRGNCPERATARHSR